MITLADAKAHLLVEHDHDDALIQRHVDAARDYLCRLSVPIDAPDAQAIVDTCTLMLVSDFYDVRNAANQTPTRENAFAVSALIAPLRKAYS